MTCKTRLTKGERLFGRFFLDSRSLYQAIYYYVPLLCTVILQGEVPKLLLPQVVMKEVRQLAATLSLFVYMLCQTKLFNTSCDFVALMPINRLYGEMEM